MRGREARVQQLRAQNEQSRLSRDQFLQQRPREEEVPIAGLGGTVLLRTITHGLRKELRAKAGFGTPEWDDDHFTRLLIVHSVVDPELTEADVRTLEDQNMTVYDEVVMAITMFTMVGSAEIGKKGSKPTQNSDSPSDLQSDLA